MFTPFTDAAETLEASVEELTAEIKKVTETPFSRYGIKGSAQGGSIYGAGTGTSDSIPALLSNGEFVVNAKASNKYRGLLESLNANRYQSGGSVGLPIDVSANSYKLPEHQSRGILGRSAAVY